MAQANTEFLANDAELRHYLPHIDKRIMYSTPDTEIRNLDTERVIVVEDSDDEGEYLPCGDAGTSLYSLISCRNSCAKPLRHHLCK